MYFLSLLIKISDAFTADNSTMSFFLFGITFNLAETIGIVQKTKQYLDLIANQPIFFKGVFLYWKKAMTGFIKLLELQHHYLIFDTFMWSSGSCFTAMCLIHLWHSLFLYLTYIRIQGRFNLKTWMFMLREIKHNIPLHHNRDSDKVKILCEICSRNLDIYVRYLLSMGRWFWAGHLV